MEKREDRYASAEETLVALEDAALRDRSSGIVREGAGGSLSEEAGPRRLSR
jgi:hypothetical protein